MALSAKEKQQRYRDRLKAKGKTEEMKAKDRERKKIDRQQMSATRRKVFLRKHRKNQEKYRQKKKLDKSAVEVLPATPYNCPQTLGKAVKKVTDALPSSPRKRTAVLRKILKEEPASKSQKPGSVPKSGLDDATKKTVREFMERDDISYVVF